MPSRSRSQQRLFAAAEHGANFAKARELRSSLTHKQLREFAVGPMKNKPEHVGHPARNLGHHLHPRKAR